MTGFRLIPVIDLRGGLVVRARAGDRHAYAPIVTPLASTAEPADVARGMLAACPSEILYVADLDAIVEGRPFDRASLEAILAACPGVSIWLDAGFAAQAAVEDFLETGFGRPVLGSESQRDSTLVRALGDRAVLSLDTRGETRLGPAELHDEPNQWPRDVIVMTLARIGVGEGPDVDAVGAALKRRDQKRFPSPLRGGVRGGGRAEGTGTLHPAPPPPPTSSPQGRGEVPAINPRDPSEAAFRVYAAGGVRGAADVAVLRNAGAAGALVSSAIHDEMTLTSVS